MLRTLDTLEPWLDFIEALQADADFADPMLRGAAQRKQNLLDAPGNKNQRLLGFFEDGVLTGLFCFLVLPEERYLEMLAGLSRSPAAYEALLEQLRADYPRWQADFVFGPRNRLLRRVLEAYGAEFEPEQQKLLLRQPPAYVPDARITLYGPAYRAQYLAMHTGERYWTGERVLAAPEIFRVLLAIEDGALAGYLDLTYQNPENEPYDLFVRPESRRKGYARALLARAIEMNRPNGMTLLSDVENRAANALYTSMGFVRAEGENSVTATLQL